MTDRTPLQPSPEAVKFAKFVFFCFGMGVGIAQYMEKLPPAVEIDKPVPRKNGEKP